jgi:hypothetical protein
MWTASGEGIRKTAFDTARFGLRRARPGDLAGGDAAYNAKVVRSVAADEPGPALDAVLANAAGVLAVRNGAASMGDFEDAFADGLDKARAAVSSGAQPRCSTTGSPSPANSPAPADPAGTVSKTPSRPAAARGGATAPQPAPAVIAETVTPPGGAMNASP